MRRAGRGAAITLVLLLVSTVAPTPATAHTLAGVEATNYRSRIISVSPATDDVDVRLLDLGRRVEVVNRGRTDVVVLGYEGEPYLRVGPRGVFVNTRSPSLYQNRPTAEGAQPEVPTTATATARPQWKRTGGGDTVRWRDHRTRWEGADPAAVREDRGATAVVTPAWTLQLERGGQQVVVTGRIVYEPPPSVLPWIVLAGVLLLVTAAGAATRRWGPALSGALAVLIAVDVVQSFASAGLSGDSTPVLVAKVLLGGIFSTVAWGVGALSIPSLQRNKEGALVGAGIAGLFIALFSGLSDLPTLANSQVPSTLPAGAARAGVAIALGIGLGLAAGVFVVIRTNPDVSLVPPSEARPASG